MSARAAVEAIRTDSMALVHVQRDAQQAVAVALAGVWDAVEALAARLTDDDAVGRDALARLVDSLPARLAAVDDGTCATHAVADRLARDVRQQGEPDRRRAVRARRARAHSAS